MTKKLLFLFSLYASPTFASKDLASSMSRHDLDGYWESISDDTYYAMDIRSNGFSILSMTSPSSEPTILKSDKLKFINGNLESKFIKSDTTYKLIAEINGSGTKSDGQNVLSVDLIINKKFVKKLDFYKPGFLNTLVESAKKSLKSVEAFRRDSK